ncbi:hypothetical protein F4813DRAFT_180636 [Daldinia decipiens]|uniref:uncharacterized protein n=1 Tax=Daldinia decipiens TaxID=326647 RepID=UPI0020C25272|nr:uncharacterized protein F4813DRAFT_180636 [Daldinia decipiens]KAI1655374.1 hypothetical protein F4813DRAFT_180636 [Daldinia decipiens]
MLTKLAYKSHSNMMQTAYSDPSFLDYFLFAVEIIKGIPDIHVRDIYYWFNSGLTPLGNILLLSADLNYALSSEIHLISRFVMVWLEALKQAGIDLETYGRREREILVEMNYIILIPYLEWRLIDFKFGPSPEDWEFYFGEPIHEYVGEFWKLVEDPPLHIPGALVDDDNHDDD